MVGRIVDISPSSENDRANDNGSCLPESIPSIENGKAPKPNNGGSCALDERDSMGVVTENDKVILADTSEGDKPPKKKISCLDSCVTIKVKDFVGCIGPSEAQVFVLPVDTTFGEFFIDVSSRFNLELGEFDVIYQDKSFSYNLAGFSDVETFESLKIVPDRDKAYWMSLDMLQQKKRKNRPAADASIVEEASIDINSATGVFDIGGHKRDFVGLKNRNMTCYLNSFLQGLWFTPEFRNAVYNYVYEPRRQNRKSLCLPLQKLFLQQQFSIRDSIETDDLIKTFGWEDRETWNQHDIEELCSIFMENLTAEFKGTNLDGLIQALYFGTLDDYVKCLECGRVSQRTDDFLVVPLPIRNFGSLLANPTLEAALNSFVAYEVLDGNNMYNCSQCEKPCPAHKGLKFKRLPYILSIQLKRFEYDFIKDRRLKLNDRVAFPAILDMNSYIETPSTDRSESLKIDLLEPKSMKVEGGRQSHSRPSISLKDLEDEGVVPSEELGAVGGEKSLKDQMKDLLESKGPEIYQLSGVMVHRGGINSGHYYAYILDFEREKWFRCDDAAVRKASVADIEVAFGGDTDEDRELTSAYMLLYRRYDPKLNILPYYLEDMPKHMQDMWEATAPYDFHQHEEEELAKNTVRISCLYVDLSSNVLVEKVLPIPKTMTMDEAAQFVFNECYANANVSSLERGCLRLCRYDKDLGIVENSFEGCENIFIVSALRQRPPVTKSEGLFLQIRGTDGDGFQAYRHDDLIFRAHLVDCVSEEMLSVEEIHVQAAETVGDLMTKVARQFNLKEGSILLVAHYLNRYCSISGDKFPLTLYKFDRINNLYVQQGNGETLADVLLDFVEQYTKAEVIEVHIQAANGLQVKLPEASAIALNHEVGPAGDAPSIITPAIGDDTKATNINKPQPTAATIEANAESVAFANLAVLANAASLIESTTTDGHKSRQREEHYIKFTNLLELPEENIFACTLRIDGHTPLYVLSQRISQLTNLPDEDFVLYKVERKEVAELRRMTERICTIKPFDRLLVKQEHRLQDGESRLGVFLLNMGCIDKPLEYITEIVVTLKMSVEEVKTAISKSYEALQSDASANTSRMRVRKKLRTNPSKIMRPNTKLQDFYSSGSLQSGEVYFQILDQPCELTDRTYCLIYRQWHPSSGVLDVTVEIAIFHDHSESLEEVILKKLRESLGLGDEIELEAAKPDVGYPFNIPSRLIQDLGWFSLNPPVKKSLYVYNDELVLFIRDKNEQPKEFDTDDLEAYRPHNMLKSMTALSEEPVRREPGLKLNLAKSPTAQD